jgi:hypothetical protein
MNNRKHVVLESASAMGHIHVDTISPETPEEKDPEVRLTSWDIMIILAVRG